MNAVRLLLQTRAESALTISVRQQLLQSFRDREYRHLFAAERLRASVALQIRSLRQQRDMTQVRLGEAIGMAQTWVSKLEDPDYGKMTVATLLRLAAAFDTDLEIKFRPFSRTLDALPTQGPDYFYVPTFEEEFGAQSFGREDIAKVRAIEDRLRTSRDEDRSHSNSDSAMRRMEESSRNSTWQEPVDLKNSAVSAANIQEQYGSHQGSARQSNLAV